MTNARVLCASRQHGKQMDSSFLLFHRWPLLFKLCRGEIGTTHDRDWTIAQEIVDPIRQFNINIISGLSPNNSRLDYMTRLCSSVDIPCMFAHQNSCSCDRDREDPSSPFDKFEQSALDDKHSWTIIAR
jgi:hypothetical protein